MPQVTDTARKSKDRHLRPRRGPTVVLCAAGESGPEQNPARFCLVMREQESPRVASYATEIRDCSMLGCVQRRPWHEPGDRRAVQVESTDSSTFSP